MAQTEVIRSLMEERDINQAALARIAGVTSGTVSQWFSGSFSPKAEPLQRMAEYFGVTVDYLLGGSAHHFIRLPHDAPRKAHMPLVGRVHAGDGSDPDILDGSVPVPYEVWERHRDAFLLEVEGDCMIALNFVGLARFGTKKAPKGAEGAFPHDSPSVKVRGPTPSP